jgi:PKD repeat protein
VTNGTGESVTPIATGTNTPGPVFTMANETSGIAITPDEAPTAAFTVTVSPAGKATAFNVSGSTANSTPIATYQWNFGDGSAQVTTEGPTTSHVYAAAGTYTMSLTVTDAAGTSTTQVYTGQTLTRNGGPGAQATRPVTIT